MNIEAEDINNEVRELEEILSEKQKKFQKLNAEVYTRNGFEKEEFSTKCILAIKDKEENEIVFFVRLVGEDLQGFEVFAPDEVENFVLDIANEEVEEEIGRKWVKDTQKDLREKGKTPIFLSQAEFEEYLSDKKVQKIDKLLTEIYDIEEEIKGKQKEIKNIEKEEESKPLIQTYNEMAVPQSIHANKIISAFENDMDEESLEYYRRKDISRCEPISGYPERITEDDVEDELIFISGEPVTKENIGDEVFYVTDGHHRATIGVEQGVNIQVEVDRGCLTDEKDIKMYEKIESKNKKEKKRNSPSMN